MTDEALERSTRLPASPASPAPTMRWDAWGVAESRKTLSPQVKALLSQALGISGDGARSPREERVTLQPSDLTATQIAEIGALVGSDNLTTADAVRLRHAGGKSTLDLLRRRSTSPQDAPDAVAFPGSHDEVLALLGYCSQRLIAVVPFGGGTSVVGGVDPIRGRFPTILALDLRRLDCLRAVDRIAGTATLAAGLTGPQAEQLLNDRGLTLGHFPQSFQFASIGGFAATRSAGQASSGNGRFDDMLQRITVATPRGALDIGRAPASAAGPDLRELFAGSEGTFGVITEVTLRVRALPERTVYQAWSFPDFAAGTSALRALAQEGAAPTVLRLSDEAETGVNLALADAVAMGSVTSGCLAITTFEGTVEHVAARSAEVSALLTAAGGNALGAAPARGWEHGRFSAPYLRDALLDAGAIAETLETATTWGNVPALREAVTMALTDSLTALGTPPLVMCHISHTYPTGASLYFTVVCAQAEQPLAQWVAAKRAAGDAIVAAGGTITHHHAVGRDHRQWMVEEIGDLGVEILRAVKGVVDPAGILNPSKLIP